MSDKEAKTRSVRRAALAGTLVFAVAVGSLILRRTALTMDERHTLLIAQVLASGEWVSFYVGSVTRYEGGSWLVAFPVAALLKLGAYGTAATSWTAATIAISAVGLGSLWLGRHAGPRAAFLLGPVCAAFPEGLHYAYRAWGSLCEALVMLPILALLHDRLRPRESSAGAVVIGGALAVSWVLSYFHFVTVLAWVVFELWEGKEEGRRMVDALRGPALAVVTAVAFFTVWVLLANPHPGEALTVRDGRSLLSTVVDLVLPRLDRVVLGLPGAVAGEITPMNPLRWAAAGVMSIAVAGAVVSALRAGGGRRRAAIFAITFLPALGVGHSLLDPPQVYRYYLPLLAAGAACVASARPWAPAVVLAGGLAFWLPSGPAMPYQNPAFTLLELGGNAMHRYSAEPHRKFMMLLPHIPSWHRRWFAFGYGLDSGRRCSPTRAGGAEWVSNDPSAAESPLTVLQPAAAWASFWDALPAGPEKADFLYGLGVGFAADGRLDRWEEEVLDTLDAEERREVVSGLGASLIRVLEERGPAAGVQAHRSLTDGLPDQDMVALGEGLVGAAAAGLPEGAGFGMSAGPRLEALRRGLAGEVNRARRAMVRVPTLPTPHPSSEPPPKS